MKLCFLNNSIPIGSYGRNIPVAKIIPVRSSFGGFFDMPIPTSLDPGHLEYDKRNSCMAGASLSYVFIAAMG